MLFLVISTPRPEHPSTLVGDRTRYWDWMRPLLNEGLARSVHARVGRGAVALFDVPSNEVLPAAERVGGHHRRALRRLPAARRGHRESVPAYPVSGHRFPENQSMNYDTDFPCLREEVSPEEWQTRVTLAACYRLMDRFRP